MYDNSFGWTRVSDTPRNDPSAPSSSLGSVLRWLSPLITLGAFAISMLVGYLAVRQQHQQQQQPGNRGARGRQRPQSHAERLASAAALIQQLPIEVYHSKQELESMPIPKLKHLLIKSGRKDAVQTYNMVLEKNDLVEALVRGDNSSAQSCSICIEDYVSGDLLRVLLPCRHTFHVECIDKWVLSATDYSRPPACPMCNTEIAL